MELTTLHSNRNQNCFRLDKQIGDDEGQCLDDFRQ